MAPNPQAQKNHDQLFPNYASKSAHSHPEFIDRFDNFAFDEVLAHTAIDPHRRLMIQLASMIAVQAITEFRVMAAASMNVGVTPTEILEILYQAVPYCGISKALDFLIAASELLAE